MKRTFFSSKLQQSFAGLCEGISPDSMRRQSSDYWTREAHLPKEYTENPPGSPGGHVSIAVPPALSRIGFLSRYYAAFEMDGNARWTPPIAHERTVTNLEKTMREIVVSGLFEKYSAIKRDGSVLYDGDDAGEWINQWHREFSRTLTDAERDAIGAEIAEIKAVCKKYTPELAETVSSICDAAMY